MFEELIPELKVMIFKSLDYRSQIRFMCTCKYYGFFARFLEIDAEIRTFVGIENLSYYQSFKNLTICHRITKIPENLEKLTIEIEYNDFFNVIKCHFPNLKHFDTGLKTKLNINDLRAPMLTYLYLGNNHYGLLRYCHYSRLTHIYFGAKVFVSLSLEQCDFPELEFISGNGISMESDFLNHCNFPKLRTIEPSIYVNQEKIYIWFKKF